MLRKTDGSLLSFGFVVLNILLDKHAVLPF